MSLQQSIAIGLVIAAVAMTGQVARANDGRPSRPVLEQMGLGSLAVMSDHEATSIRGQGYKGGSSVYVSGNSSARIGDSNGLLSAQDSDEYRAHGRYVAKGGSFSIAGVIVVSSGGYGNDYDRRGPGQHGGKVTIKSITVFAGGHSSAWAF